MSKPRSWVRRVALALAGGGLTAAGLSGPLSGWALGADTGNTGPVQGSAEGSAVPSVASESPSPSRPREATTTTSTPAPAPSPPSASTPKGSTPQASGTPEAPAVVVQRRQRTTDTNKHTNPSLTATKAQPKAGAGASHPAAPSGPNNVALAPQIVAAEAGALAAELAGSAASAQALAFYRIPLFLLPIYQAAAVQYGVPWQILAAINEIETNYGVDQSVSTAGAVGWMQFMPATWMQYGVDALNAGYADPYNPVDAVFAAARYLRAAGAASDLHGAILAYNHSEEYVSSVLLRAKLISTYPKPVIATLTGLIDDRLPVTGKRLAWGPLAPGPSSQSATANATALPSAPSAPPSPSAAALIAGSFARPAPPQLVELSSAPNAAAVAVQDGRIVSLGRSRSLGRYVILRDVYGDVFTYAGLGSIAPTYRLPKAPPGALTAKAPGVAAGTHDPAPAAPASAGRPGPLTLRVQSQSAPVKLSLQTGESTPAGMGRLRLFAHPGNPDARAAAALKSARRARAGAADRPLPLRAGSVLAKGTVLGHVRTPLGATDGHLRFAIQPAHDLNTIDPRPILRNWVQLDTALHPKGATGDPQLLGATASDVFLFTKTQLQREVLSDPAIALEACARREVAAGAIDRRVLALLAFLSRSSLRPTVGTLRCSAGAYDIAGYVPATHLGDALAITKINGQPIAGHQGPGTITDLTIRTLLTLQGEFVPHQIVSLMRYPGAPSTLARADHGAYIEVVFSPAPKRALTPKAARPGAGAAKTAAAPLAAGSDLSPAQWNQLIGHIATLPVPVVSVKPSSSAIPDPKRP